MNQTFRIVLAFVFIAAVVAIGMNGTAWASKLNIGGQAQAGNGFHNDGPVGSRPAGSVQPNPHIYVLGAHLAATVASCATVKIGDAPAGVTYTASDVQKDQLPGVLPGKLESCGMKIEANPTSKTLNAEVQVCFPVPPTHTGFAYYYDGTEWVKTAAAVQDNQSCIQIPASAVDPAISALFE